MADLGLSVKLLYNDTRVGLIGEGIGKDPTGLVAMGETLKSRGLPLNTISFPLDGIALSIMTDQTYVPAIVRGLYDRVFRSPTLTSV